MIDVVAKLSAPFPPSAVSWRVGSTSKDKSKGLALAYIDARDVMDRLDTVLGPENWQNRYSHANGKTVCDIGIRFGADWIWKADGAGDSDVEAEKGALSDAFKRAAVRWGVGRYLYGLGNTWVTLEARGNSHVIPESEHRKLEAILARLSGGPANTAPIQQQAPKPKSQARPEYAKISEGIRKIRNEGSNEDLTLWYKTNVKTIETLGDWITDIMAEFTAARDYLTSKEAA